MMPCCGEPRTTVRASSIESELAVASHADVRVAYLGRNSLTVRGTYTGRRYAFSPTCRVQTVDPLDSRVMLRTRYFRLV